MMNTQASWSARRVALCLAIVMTSGGLLYAADQNTSIDALVAALAGEDDAARVQARQLLPYKGAEAVPKLVPLLIHESAQVWWAADKVIRDLANKAAVPGREADCALISEALLAALAPDQSEAMKKRVLRIIPIAIPSGGEVGPVAALLSDPTLKEKARVALAELATPEAAEALCAAIDAADPAFQAALFRGVARMDYAPALDKAVPFLKSEDPVVRAAAARVLSESGDLTYLEALNQVRKTADKATAFDAADAYLRLVDNAGYQGGHWPEVMAAYRALLADTPELVFRSGALVGLGRFGDESVLDDVLNAVTGEGGRDLEPAAAQALAFLQGENALRAIIPAL